MLPPSVVLIPITSLSNWLIPCSHDSGSPFKLTKALKISFPTLFKSSSTTNSFFFKMFFSYRALFKSYFMISFSYFKCWSLTLKISTEFISSEHWCRRLSFSIIPFHKTMFRLQSCSFNSKFYPSRSRTTLANCSTSNLWFWSILWKLFMSIITVFNFQAWL